MPKARQNNIKVSLSKKNNLFERRKNYSFPKKELSLANILLPVIQIKKIKREIYSIYWTKHWQ